jgi:pseudaminic acid synthase
MVTVIEHRWSPDIGPASSRPLRRSLFCIEDIAAGAMFSTENIRSIRPGHGLPPAMIGDIIGKRAARFIARGESMQWDMVET